MVWFGRQLKTHPVPTPPAMGRDRDRLHYTRLLKTPLNLDLNSSREGSSTAPLGNLCQDLTTFIAKNFFLKSNINLPSFRLKPLPLVLSLRALVKSPSPAFSQPPSGTGRLLESLPGVFSSPGWTIPTLTAFPHRSGVTALWSSSWPFSGPTPTGAPEVLDWVGDSSIFRHLLN